MQQTTRTMLARLRLAWESRPPAADPLTVVVVANVLALLALVVALVRA